MIPTLRAPACALLLLGSAVPVHHARAQRPDQTVQTVAGARYRAGGLRQWLLGDGYRDVWTAPIQAPVLNPDTFAGGLTVEQQGGGNSTESLRLKARNGREYAFRSVDKNAAAGLGPDLRGTLVQSITQDMVSGKHPASALMVPPLLDAVGVLHATARYYVMPDHPFLGEFRERFKGRLGMLEERPADGFGGSRDVQGSDDFQKKIEDDPEDRPDARAFLTARLMDLFVGDWDRHWDQWRWARFDEGGIHWWRPIPRDRDNAFSDQRGLIPGIGRGMVPILVHFEPEYDALRRYENQPAELDRLILSRLPREAWDSTVTWVRSRLTDAVIERAVRNVPAPYYAVAGEEMSASLKARRDALPQIAAELYQLLAREVDVHTTDKSEQVEVVRLADGGVDVTIRTSDDNGTPYFHRVLRPGETREVRLYLHGGDDRAIVRGASPGGGILVRIIGGGGNDQMGDQSTAAGGRRTVFYDDKGANSFDPRDEAKVDTREWNPPRPTTLLGNPPPPRDWGTSSTLLGIYANWELNIGPVIGLGPQWKRYGFRRTPHAEQIGLRVLYAPFEHNGVGAMLHYDRQITNRPASVWLNARGSNFEDVRFHGFGNQSPEDPDRDAYEVDQTQVRVQAAYQIRPSNRLTIHAGPAAKWTDPGTVAAQNTGVLGNETFWQAGAIAGAALDLRDSVMYPRHGGRALVNLSGYGSDLSGPFGRVDGEAAWYGSVPGSFGPTLALRAGGQWAVGDFPFQEAAFVGGPMNLRGFPYQRFRGDASLFGSAELRARLAYLNLGIVRTHLGAFALADAGRVYVDGDSPGGWHTGVGGGLSFQTVGRTATVAYARGERNSLYVTIGMPF
ncbi:MAG TPA: BamA/TamA family outer membrane protein [Longimicrobium sp.]|nr:BamA/TamA family outer membrane protein [Longimicrobium sp.]